MIGRAPNQARTRLITLGKVVLAVALLVWLFRSRQLDLAILAKTQLNGWAIAAAGALLANMVLQAMRWWLLLRMQNMNLSLGEAIQLSWVGQFFSLVLPGAAGGELVRGYYLMRERPNGRLAALSTLILDRGLGLYSLLWLAAPWIIVLGAQGRLPRASVAISGVMLAVLATSILGLALPWIAPIRRFMLSLIPTAYRNPTIEVLRLYQSRPRLMLACFGISLLSIVMVIIAFRAVGSLLGSSLPWTNVFIVVPWVAVANSLPISPGGIGVGETSASILFAQFGVTTGAEIMLIIRLGTTLLRLPGGLIYLARRNAWLPAEAAQSLPAKLKGS
jgi:uncharacterized membrane protein YbhN (UPF0104 family)